MADQKISELVNILGENVEDSDEFVISDTSAGDNKALTWGEMRDEFYTPQNLLGTVSESGGVPTGAVIERGSNANGEYVRFADGTQICYQDFEVTNLAVTTARGSAFRSASLTVPTFPASFVGLPVVCLRGGFVTNVDGWVTKNGSTTTTDLTNGTLRAFSLVSLTETFRWSYLAVGNWF